MNRRNVKLDILRGITIVSMAAYHAVWDLNYIFGMRMGWYEGLPGYVWQQSICWTFILLSGYLAGCSCANGQRREMVPLLARSGFRRGLQVFACGALITAVTLLFMPQDRVVFGVLTLIGTCKILTALLQDKLSGIHAGAGLALSGLAFLICRHVDQGWLGIPADPRLWLALSLPFSGGGAVAGGGTAIGSGPAGLLLRLPGSLYRDYLTAYLGFPQPGFFSTDYFPLLPWLFLFLCGLFLRLAGRRPSGRIQEKACPKDTIPGGRDLQGASGSENRRELMRKNLQSRPEGRDPGPAGSILAAAGRHALLIYMLHQPLIYGILWLFFQAR